MAPGPKKKSFLTPRNNRNNQSNKSTDNSKPIVKDDSSKDPASNVEGNSSNCFGQKKYSKRSIENNWAKYEEPVFEPYADYSRGKNIEVMLSFSGESGTQLKLKEEKEWENDSLNSKDISLNLQDLVKAMKCIPFHERINVKNYFNDKQIENFILSAENCKKFYKPDHESQVVPHNDIELLINPAINIIEESNLIDSDDSSVIKNYVVQDETVDIINSLASNLTFKDFKDSEKKPLEKASQIDECDKNSELASNDLDFLLSLNISSKATESNVKVPKTSNVDDWLNSILDD